MDINLLALTSDDREQFILDNQEAFNFGALEEFGRRDDHFEVEVCFFNIDIWRYGRLNSSVYHFIMSVLTVFPLGFPPRLRPSSGRIP